MDAEDLNLIGQLVESMSIASEQLEKAVNKRDIEKVKRAKDEIIKFQMQIKEILREK